LFNNEHHRRTKILYILTKFSLLLIKLIIVAFFMWRNFLVVITVIRNFHSKIVSLAFALKRWYVEDASSEAADGGERTWRGR
jgi:hypothetical protein